MSDLTEGVTKLAPTLDPRAQTKADLPPLTAPVSKFARGAHLGDCGSHTEPVRVVGTTRGAFRVAKMASTLRPAAELPPTSGPSVRARNRSTPERRPGCDPEIIGGSDHGLGTTRPDRRESTAVSRASVPSGETSPSIATIVDEVGEEIPGVREKTSPDGMLTIAFTDIEGSTEIMERLGEDRFVEMMIVHDRMVRDCVGAHGGEVVKSQGDGYMIIFSSASAALDCAVELQRILTRYHVREPAETLLIRVGLHTGNIFQADYDFLGKAVVLAARITGRAQGGEILVSAACRDYTRRLGRWRYGEAMELSLKGLASVERVYPLDWWGR